MTTPLQVVSLLRPFRWQQESSHPISAEHYNLLMTHVQTALNKTGTPRAAAVESMAKLSLADLQIRLGEAQFQAEKALRMDKDKDAFFLWSTMVVELEDVIKERDQEEVGRASAFPVQPVRAPTRTVPTLTQTKQQQPQQKLQRQKHWQKQAQKQKQTQKQKQAQKQTQKPNATPQSSKDRAKKTKANRAAAVRSRKNTRKCRQLDVPLAKASMDALLPEQCMRQFLQAAQSAMSRGFNLVSPKEKRKSAFPRDAFDRSSEPFRVVHEVYVTHDIIASGRTEAIAAAMASADIVPRVTRAFPASEFSALNGSLSKCFYLNFEPRAQAQPLWATEARVRGDAYDSGRFITPAMESCMMKHYAVMYDMVQRNIPSALVLEDDVVMQDTFAYDLADLLQHNDLPKDWAIIHLTACRHFKNSLASAVKRSKKTGFVPMTGNAGTVSYLITNKFARLALSYLPYRSPVDLELDAVIRTVSTCQDSLPMLWAVPQLLRTDVGGEHSFIQKMVSRKSSASRRGSVSKRGTGGGRGRRGTNGGGGKKTK